jgi:hypothetical protein
VLAGSGTARTFFGFWKYAKSRRSILQNQFKRDCMTRFFAIFLMLTSGMAIAQTTGTVSPTPPAEPSVKQDVSPGSCMPIGMTASGEMVFPMQCREIIERERGKIVERTPSSSQDETTAKSGGAEPNLVIKPVETVPLPKARESATNSDNRFDCRRYRTYNPRSRTYRDYDGKQRSCN